MRRLALISDLALNSSYRSAYRGGGPIRTLEAMASEQPDKIVFKVLTSDSDLGSKEGRRMPKGACVDVDSSNVFYGNTKFPFRRYRDVGQSFRDASNHTHGRSLFSFFNPIVRVPLIGLRIVSLYNVGKRHRLGAGN